MPAEDTALVHLPQCQYGESYCHEIVDMLTIDTRRCAEEGGGESAAGAAPAELSASEQPADHQRPAGQFTFHHSVVHTSSDGKCPTGK